MNALARPRCIGWREHQRLVQAIHAAAQLDTQIARRPVLQQRPDALLRRYERAKRVLCRARRCIVTVWRNHHINLAGHVCLLSTPTLKIDGSELRCAPHRRQTHPLAWHNPSDAVYGDLPR